MRPRPAFATLLGLLLVLSACGVAGHPIAETPPSLTVVPPTETAIGAPATFPAPKTTAKPTTTTKKPPPVRSATLPQAGNPSGHASVPAAGQPVNTSHPDHVVGNGTAASCTSSAVVAAVAAGGVITFSCGPAPVTITMAATAKVRNASSQVVIDGGDKVTLSGAGARRILYMDTCDEAQGFTTSHCDNQSTPHLTVQNMTFTNGNSTGQEEEGGGGGAILDRGGRLTVINSRFTHNRCDSTGPDLGGAAVRALSQYNGDPVYIVGSTFGGASGAGGICSNGGALSSIGVSWVVLNSLMTYNEAIGHGANPASAGTPGGGSGGAIYTDGNTYTVRIAGTVIEHNHANEGGGAIFYVSNDKTGTMSIDSSTLEHNPSDEFETAGFPGIFFLGAHPPTVTSSTLAK
ncbi:MAG TPA: hypothetical protein VFX16_24125 [Pseudonocardiaceae bacterium]|nr:hypothetical protein [Pseudonocardiaceae bacterium]